MSYETLGLHMKPWSNATLTIAGRLLAGAAVAAGLTIAAQPAGAAALPPQVTIVPGGFYTTGSTEQLGETGVDYVVPFTVKWAVSAPAGICAESARIDDGYGATLASFTKSAAPFPTQLGYLAYPWGAYSNGDPPPFVTVTVTDCAGNSDTAAINLPVRAHEESKATYSAGWGTGTCTCWSLGAVRKSTGAGQTATYTGTFSGIALLTDRAPGRGTADIYVDGRFVRSINAAAPTTTNRLIGFQTHFAKTGTHTLQVRVTSGRVDVDAFLTTYTLSGWGRPV